MTEQQDWQQVAAGLREADGSVAFTGAGISTESGIPDFRSPGGIWSKSQPVMYEDFLASAEARHEYWRRSAGRWAGSTRSSRRANRRIT